MAGENTNTPPAGGAASATPPAGGAGDGAAPNTNTNTPPAGDTALGTQPQGAGSQGGQGEPGKAAPVELKLPEGVTLADEVLKEYKELVKQFDPQKGLEFLLKTREGAVADLQAQVQAQVEKQRADWLATAKADKEIGGAAWDATLTSARSAVSSLGGDALREVLNKTGLGNHPEVIRAFARAGKALSEDSIGGRGGSGADEREDLSKLTPEERIARSYQKST